MTTINTFGPTTVELLFQRRAAQSAVGKRADGRHIALVIEGGAMRGVVSAGMVAALETLDLRGSFDSIYGASAGAIAGAYFAAGQARFGTTIYYQNINNNKFVDIKRFLIGQSIVSTDFLLDQVCRHEKPLDAEAAINSDVPLNVIASSLKHKKAVCLSLFSGPEKLFSALKASSRIPLFAGPPVPYEDDLLIDASLYESIPVRSAMEHSRPTDLVILLTRPAGNLRSAPNFIDRYIVAPYFNRYGREITAHYLNRKAEYEAEISEIDQYKLTGVPRVLVMQTSSNDPKVSTLEKNRDNLIRGASDGFKAVYNALGLGKPELAEILIPMFRGRAS